MFVPLTVTKYESADGKETSVGCMRVRYRIDKVTHYQEYDSKTSIVWINGNKFYVKESIDQLDLLFQGASELATKILFGKHEV